MATPTTHSASAARGPFKNEVILDFSKEENAAKMREAIAQVRKQLGREYPLIIGGEKITTTDKIKSVNPAKPSEVIGIHQKAGAEHVEPAMQAAQKAFKSWSVTGWEDRANILFSAADIIRKRRFNSAHGLYFEVSEKILAKPTPTFAAETIELPGILRTRSTASFRRRTRRATSRRNRDTLAIYSPRCRRRDSSVEFSVRNYGGYDHAPRLSAATPVILKPSSDSLNDRRKIYGSSGRSRACAGRCSEFLSRRRAQVLWRRYRQAS